MDFPKKQQQCLIPRYLLQYLQDLQISHNDPTAEWGGSGSIYTAGDGITISDDVISIDDTVALKTDIPSLSGYATQSWVLNQGYVKTGTDQRITGDKTFSGSTVFTGETSYQGNYYNVYLHRPGEPGLIVASPTEIDPDQTWFSGIYPGSIQIGGSTGNVNIYPDALENQSEFKIRLKSGRDTIGEYTFKNKTGDVAITSEIPTATSDLTNDSGYITSSDLSNYVTSTDLAAELLNYAELDDLPTDTSDLTNGAGYITSSALSGYATETWVTNQGYSTFSGSYNDLTDAPSLATVATTGDYNDLTNKPTIPTVPTNVSAFTNDAGYITSSALNDYVTTNTNQDITGKKTFKTNPIDVVNTNKGIQLHSGNNNSTNSKLGFTLYNSAAGSSNNEVGFLEASTYSASNNGHSTLLGYYNTSTTINYSDWDLGFAYNGYNNTKGGVTAYKLVMPNQYNLNSYNTKRYIPIDFTDGTNTVRSDATGVVNINSLLPTVPTNVSAFANDAGYITGITSTDVTTALGYTPGTSNFSGSYNDLTDKPTIPDAVSGTNDGTNWTSLTIGSDTYGIPSGGGSSGPTITRYTGYASHPITYAVPSGQTQYSYMYISIYSSELSGFLNYDNVNPGDILYIDTTLGYTLSNNQYMRSSKLFTVSVPPKPDSTYPTYTISTDDPADGNISGMWACSTVNRLTNTQETTASNIVQKTANGLDTTNNFYIRVPLWSRSNLTITITVNSITHVAF